MLSDHNLTLIHGLTLHKVTSSDQLSFLSMEAFGSYSEATFGKQKTIRRQLKYQNKLIPKAF